MIRLLPAGLRRLAADERGSVAMVVAVSIVMMTLLGGLAVDTGRIFLAREGLSHALDDAGLAVGANAVGYTGGEGACGNTYLVSIATTHMNANYSRGSIGTLGAPVVCQSTNGNTIVIANAVTVPTYFMSIMGYTSVTATASTQVSRSAAGIELVMVLDNTASMATAMSGCTRSGSSYSGTAFACLLNSSYQLLNTVYGATSAECPNGTSFACTGVTTYNNLFVGLVPFDGVVNALNQTTTTFNGSTLTQYNELLGSDYAVTVANIVYTSSTGVSTPLCGYNGWTPAANDYVSPLDLIHLAQDLCLQYVSTISSSTGAETFSGNPTFADYYLVNWLNTNTPSSLTTGTGPSGYAWSGCVEERASYNDTSSTPYYDYNTASGWTPSLTAYPNGYDNGIDYVGLTSGSYASNPSYLWHIYRKSRNASYLPNPSLPNNATMTSAGGTLTSKYYAAATTAIYKTTSGSTYYLVTGYNYPKPVYMEQTCSSSACTAPYSATTYGFSSSFSTSGLTLQSGTAPTTNSTNYYWAAPSGSLNGSCIISTIVPLTNVYATISSGLSAMDDTGGTGTNQEPGMSWAARALGMSGTAVSPTYHPPLLETQTIDATTFNGAQNWRKIVVFLTDGNPDIAVGSGTTPSDYLAYSTILSSSNAWAQTNVSNISYADPPFAAYGDNSDPVNANNGELAADWSAFPSTSGYCNFSTTSVTGSGKEDDAQPLCRTYQVCKALRAQNYYIYNVFFQDETTDTLSSAEGAFMAACTANGQGGINSGQSWTVTTPAELSSAFQAIGTQIANLRLSL